MRKAFFFLIFLSTFCFLSCGDKTSESIKISVKNDLNIERSFETIEITKEFLGLSSEDNIEFYGVKSLATNQFLITQFIDENFDGIADILLFQPVVLPLSEVQFEIVKLDTKSSTDVLVNCYSRFVPERTDDYAWENDRVAFRTFGPTAQKMIEDNIKGGTLSSGIDAWLKKVDYPIINKWYDKNTSEKGSYHKDTGEGLDNFHVGISRGVGGVAVKKDSAYYLSKNFTAWKTISTGPIRTSFVLTYADWDAAGNVISEEKHVSLDYGSNLSKFEINIKGTDTLASGLTLHKKEGEVTVNETEGWISYWEPLDDSELGTGIVAPKSMIGTEHYLTDLKDASNLYALLKVDNNKVVYYAGFGWKKSKQFDTKEVWNDYLAAFAEKINNPLKVQLR